MTLLRTLRPTMTGFLLAAVAGLTLFGAAPARAQAIMEGRAYVTPQDVKDVGFEVLRHRIIRSYEAEADNISVDSLVGRIFDHVEVP